MTRSNTSGSPTATYTIANGTTDSADFGAGFQSTGTVSFAAGATTAVISVPIAGDYRIEGNETFTVTLSNPSGAAIATNGGVGTGTITNDDAVGTFVLTGSSTFEGNSGNTNATFTVTRTGGRGDADFAITSLGGTATSGVDYVAPGTLTFAFRNGSQSESQVISIIGDNLVEGDETITLAGGTFTAGGSLASRGPITIRNDDFVGSISASDVSVTEGDNGSVTGYFTITRTGGLAAGTVSYAIESAGSSPDTTATAGVDFSAAASGTVSFGVGQTTALVPFQVLGDTLPERNETFRIQLSNATNGGTIGRSVGTATIVDNDATPGSQFGTSGNDTLIANTSGAMLIGFGGDDTYLVNSSSDMVIEQAGGGADIVYTTVSYNLGVNEVEALSVANQQTTNSINLIGNYASQTIVGNYGDNVLNGGSGGVDTLIGLFGNDTYAVGDSRTVVVEQAGQGFDTLVTSVNYTLAAGVSIETFTAQDRASTTGLRLVGNEVSQTIAGTAGNDTIMGGGGSDTLLGGAGADTFVIGTVASGNVAVLADFVSGTDRIGLSTTAFAGLGTALDANEFVVGSAAVGTNAQIVYNQATGQLFYDADGTGSGAAVLFAQVVPGTVINTGAFDMIAPAAMAA